MRTTSTLFLILALGLFGPLSFSSQNLLAQAIPFTCGTDDSHLSPALIQQMQSLSRDTVPMRARMKASPKLECLVAVDVDYRMYQLFDGNQDHIRQYVYDAIARASTVFERDLNVKLTVSYINIWDKTDPYPTTEIIQDHLTAMSAWWRKNMVAVPRHLVVSLTSKRDPKYSGLGYLGSNKLSEGCIIGSIDRNNDQHAIIVHEIGHVFGSPHTHNCNWAGGPIDYCAKVEGASCYTGPLVSQIGTYMSYCQGSDAFHPLCIALMRPNAEKTGLPLLDRIPEMPTWTTLQQTVNLTAPYLSWNRVDRTENYRVQIATDTAFTAIVLDSTVRYSYWRAYNLKSDTDYFVRMKAQNSFGESDWSAPLQLSIKKPVKLSSPAIKSPVNRKINFAGNTLEWYPVEGASSYKVQLLSSQTALLEEKTITGATSYPVPAVQLSACNNCDRYWRVKSIQNTDTSEWSSMYQFRSPIQVPIQFPDLTRANELRHSTSVPIAWNNYIAYNIFGESISSVQISDQPDFKTLFAEKKYTHNRMGDTERTPFPIVMVEGLAPNQTYYFRIKVRDVPNNIESEWAAGSFKTGLDRRRWSYYNGASSPLPMSGVNNLYVSPSGTVWIATSQGLFGTSNFKNWTIHNWESSRRKLPNTIRAVTQDLNGNLWICSIDNEIYRYDGAEWRLVTTSTTMLNQLVFDGQNRLYVGTNNGLFYWNDIQLQKITDLPRMPDNMSEAVTDMFKDRQGRVIVRIGNNAIFRSNGSTWDLLSKSESGYPVAKSFYTNNMALDSNTVWTCGTFGVARLKPDDTWEIIPTSTITGNGNNYISKLSFTQNELVVWESRNLYRYNGKTWKIVTDYYLPAGQPSKVVSDSDGRIWSGSYAYGISVYDPRTIQPGSLSSRSVCVGEKITFPFTLNFTPKPGVTYRAELSDETGSRFNEVASTVVDKTVTIQLPDKLETSSNYKVRILADAGTTIYGDESQTFTVKPYPKASITAPESMTVCEGGLFTLRSEVVSVAAYQWLREGTPVDKATDVNLSIVQGGQYVVTVTKDGCTSTSKPVTVSYKPGIKAIITPEGPTTIYAPASVRLNATTGEGFSYQWLKNGATIDGATSASYEASSSGNYTVQIIVPNTCVAISPEVAVKVDAVLAVNNPVLSDQFTIIPNPVDKRCIVYFPQLLAQNSEIQLVDLNGRTVLRQPVSVGQSAQELDVRAFSPGVYTLIMPSNKGNLFKRLLKY